jgi:anti-anti-sigma factor
VVDLTAVTFVDSSTLNALVRGQRALGDRGISMSVVAPLGGIVRRVLDIAHLTDTLNVLETSDGV